MLLVPAHSLHERQKNAAAGEKKSMTQGVEFNRLMLDMRAMQAEAMSQTKVAAAPELAPGQSSFADMLGQAIGKVNEVQQASTQLSNAFEIGKSGVDLTDVMIASQKASVSFQALTQVRNKLVQAYQDIMQMPV